MFSAQLIEIPALSATDIITVRKNQSLKAIKDIPDGSKKVAIIEDTEILKLTYLYHKVDIFVITPTVDKIISDTLASLIQTNHDEQKKKIIFTTRKEFLSTSISSEPKLNIIMKRKADTLEAEIISEDESQEVLEAGVLSEIKPTTNPLEPPTKKSRVDPTPNTSNLLNISLFQPVATPTSFPSYDTQQSHQSALLLGQDELRYAMPPITHIAAPI